MKGQARIKCAGGGIVVLGGGWRRERGGNIWMTLNIFTVKQAVFCAVEPDGNLGGFFLNRFSRRKWNKPILLRSNSTYWRIPTTDWISIKRLEINNFLYELIFFNIQLPSNNVSCFLYRSKFKTPIELFKYTVYSLSLVLYVLYYGVLFKQAVLFVRNESGCCRQLRFSLFSGWVFTLFLHNGFSALTGKMFFFIF